ncbi:MAG: long-chain fatty acid--CoA ligase [Oligoflexales bacterium]|nr:long-chain fatty acid--CoA ligase [Oligoflexales bacterium]
MKHGNNPVNLERPGKINLREITLPHALSQTAREHPEHTALVFFGNRISFRHLDEMASSMASALLDLGVKKGDKVALLMPNMPQMVIATYAAWRMGAVIVMNNPLYTDTELEHQLSNSDATVLVTLDLLYERMMALKGKTRIRTVIVAHLRDHLSPLMKTAFPILARKMHRKVKKQAGVHEWSELLKKYPPAKIDCSLTLKDLASLQYTGGTTGVSKGVMLTHENLSDNAQQGLACVPNLKSLETVAMGTLPIFHAFGLFTLNLCVLGVWTLVLVPKPETEIMMKTIQKQKATLFMGVPTMFISMLNHPKLKKYDLSSLVMSISGAAPCPVDVIRKFENLTGSMFIEGYGLSEASPAVCLNPVNGRTKPGSIGLPAPNTEIRIVDLNDPEMEMPQGSEGELVIRGPQVSTMGYYKKPEESMMTFRDGWLYTGDIARVDEEGYVFLVDRKKDMIIAGGYKIFPKEIDELLFSHPQIEEACTKGVSDPYLGEKVKVYVVVKPGEVLTEEEIVEYCKPRVAPYKVPKSVQFVDALPRNSVGKVLRRELP